MPKRETGLMGYVGEAVVEQWLQLSYPEEKGYSIVSQIVPSELSNKGGGHLDFGVLHNDAVKVIYEVKSQNYIFNKSEPKLNNALLYIWNNNRESLVFETQAGKKYKGCGELKVFLVLLVAPNTDGMNRIGDRNLPNVILFQEIWDDLRERNGFNADTLIKSFEEDMRKVISILQKPSEGKNVTSAFVSRRQETKVHQGQ